MTRPVTLITGTRKGIGRHLAEHYLKQGHTVIGCSRSPTEWTHQHYHHFTADVANEPDVTSMLSFIRKKFGQLDNLLNNAGIASMNHVMLTPLATVQAILNTNVVGTFLLCRDAAKLMAQHQYGRIVNFTTVATPLKLEGEAIYAASKAAVHTLTEIMAREFAPFNITVNAVGPTPIDTDLIRSVPQDKIDNLLSRQAINRKGTPADVAHVTDFFLQASSGFITGQNIFLGGI
jgi:3-oxoacyl-[acyl-carrier protein] reductase